MGAGSNGIIFDDARLKDKVTINNRKPYLTYGMVGPTMFGDLD